MLWAFCAGVWGALNTEILYKTLIGRQLCFISYASCFINVTCWDAGVVVHLQRTSAVAMNTTPDVMSRHCWRHDAGLLVWETWFFSPSILGCCTAKSSVPPATCSDLKEKRPPGAVWFEKGWSHPPSSAKFHCVTHFLFMPRTYSLAPNHLFYSRYRWYSPLSGADL